MNVVMTVAVNLVAMTCGKCGTSFAMQEDKYQRCVKEGEDWYCPNGHNRIFTETELSKTRKALAEEKAKRKQDNDEWATAWRNKRDELDASKRELKTARYRLTRTQNKLKQGICPCCNQRFPDLATHMEEQHPDYAVKEEQVQA